MNWQAPSKMPRNAGKCPEKAYGRRVRVQLVNGYDSKVKEPTGWAASGAGACNWSLTGDPFDIAFWELI